MLLFSAPRQRSVIYEYVSFLKTRHEIKRRLRGLSEILTKFDGRRLTDIVEAANSPYWYPTTDIVPGEQGNPFLNRGIGSRSISFYTSQLEGFGPPLVRVQSSRRH